MMNTFKKNMIIFSSIQLVLFALYLVLLIIDRQQQILSIEVHISIPLRFIIFSMFLIVSFIESIMLIRFKRHTLGATILVLSGLILLITTIYQMNHERAVFYYEEDGYNIIVERNIDLLIITGTFYYQKNGVVYELFAEEERLLVTSSDFHITDGYLIITNYFDGEIEVSEYKIP